MKPFEYLIAGALAAVIAVCLAGTVFCVHELYKDKVCKNCANLQAPEFHPRAQQCFMKCPRCNFGFYCNVPVRKLGDTGATVGEVIK